MGEPCTCPDGTESELQCSSDESTCSCADHAKSDDDDEPTDDAKDDEAAMEADIKKRDGFSLDCNHGGGHMIAPNGQDAAWQFMQDHPHKTKPSPYVAGGIPKGFPSYCKVP